MGLGGNLCNYQTLFFQGEMQQLRDKLAIAERAAKSEAQLKVIKWFINFSMI